MKHKLTGGDSSGKATELQQHLDNEQRGIAVRAVGGSSSSTMAICWLLSLLLSREVMVPSGLGAGTNVSSAAN